MLIQDLERDGDGIGGHGIGGVQVPPELMRKERRGSRQPLKARLNRSEPVLAWQQPDDGVGSAVFFNGANHGGVGGVHDF